MANQENTTRISDHPNYQPARFWVKVTQPIQSRKRLLDVGDCALIDPNAVPKTGDLVLNGDRLEMWNGRDRVEGVAVQVSTEDI